MKPPIVLRLITDEGLYGLGEFPLCYGTAPLGDDQMLQEMVQQFVIGADPMRIEAMWNTIFHRTFWGQGGGPVVYGGMSTIDQALWDIKGKALGRRCTICWAARCTIDLHVYCNGWIGDEYAPGEQRCREP